MEYFHPLAGEDGRWAGFAGLFLFNATGNFIEHLHALERVFADGGLTGEHDAVGEFKDGVGNVGDLRAGRDRLRNHALQHVGGDDDRAALGEAGADGAALDHGEFLERALDAEVAAGDHQGVAGGDDTVEVIDGRLVLDLGDDAAAGFFLAEKRAEHRDIFGFADEREGDEIDALFEADGGVGAVFFGEGREVYLYAGEVDVAFGFQLAGDQDAATDAGRVLGQDFEAEEAIVDEDGVADLDVVDEVLVVDVDGADFLAALDIGAAGAGFNGEVEDLAGFKLDGHGEVAGTDFGALNVHHDGDVAADAGADGADAADDHAGPVVFGVRHIEADDAGTGAKQFLEHLFAFGGGPEGDDDFGAADGIGVHARTVVQETG